MTVTAFDDDVQRFAKLQRTERDKAIQTLPVDVILALAAAPFWTPRTLAAVGVDVAQVLADGRAILRHDGFGDDLTLSLATDATRDVMTYVLATPNRETISMIAALGSRLTSAEKPPVLAHWAKLAAALSGGPDGAGELLIVEVREACERGEPGTATELAEAAGALARVVGREFAVAERIARHRIEREFRAARDRAQLSCYVVRADADAAFEHLLVPDGPWAQHYVGVGGAGKTTFIRHLAVVRAAELGMSVARIDFDYLSPAYPGRDPGQLVEAIVHELSVHITQAEQDSWYRSIQEHLKILREVARGVRSDDPIGPIAWPEFQDLLPFVSSFLSSFGKPLLIFDTCEELMKLPPVGRTIPSVEATFRLIEELHKRVLGLRVIFAGRRLLAKGGAGWAASQQGMTQALSEARPYLALHELRGMMEGEAREVLAQLLPEARRTDASLVGAILAACPEDGRISALAAETEGEYRFSPYRLVRFARWVAAEPTLSPDKLDQGADPYIEQRIVQRMGLLSDLLPVVVQLRRFDADTLAAVLGMSLATAEATVAELAGHEWIYAFDISGRGTVVEPSSSIRDELETYLRAHRASPWQAAREAIAAALGPRLVAPGAVAFQPEFVDAVLRALPEVAAVRVWFTLESHIGTAWNSALTLTRFLTGDDNAGADSMTLLGAAIGATQISAIIHEEPDLDVGEAWSHIAQAMANIEQTETAVVLRCRAQLGIVAASGWRSIDNANPLVRTLLAASKDLGPNAPPAAATWVIAAVEGLVEGLERDYTTCDRLADLADGCWLPLAGASTPGLDAWTGVLRARMGALLHRPEAHAPLDAHLASTDWGLPETCVDWIPPISLRDRIQLEAVRLQFWKRDSLRLLSPTPSSEDADVDRLLSACGQRNLAETGNIEPYAPRPVRRHNLGLREPTVYRRFPPAAVTSELMRWDADDISPDVTGVDRAHIGYERARRRRDPELLEANVRSASYAHLFIEAARAAAVVLGRDEPIPPGIEDPRELAEHWSYQRAISHRDRARTVDRILPHIGAFADTCRGNRYPEALHAFVTFDEIAELARGTRSNLSITLDPPQLRDVHPDQVELATRLELRLAARRQPLALPRRTEVTLAVVPHLVARLAIEEAELLALRLPQRAAALFDFAKTTLLACGDARTAGIAWLGYCECMRLLGVAVLFDGDVALPLRVFAQRLDASNGPANQPSSLNLLEVHSPPPPSPPHSRRVRQIALSGGWLAGAVAVKVSTALVFGSGWSTVSAVALLILWWILFWQRLFPCLRWRPLSSRPGSFSAKFTLATLARDKVSIEYSAALVREAWPAAMPRAGQTPSIDSTTLDAFREEAAHFTEQTQLVRVDMERGLIPYAWEVALVAHLPHVVAWRPIGTNRRAGVRNLPPDSYDIDEIVRGAWVAGTKTTLSNIDGLAHFIGRPRRRLGSIELELASGELARLSPLDRLDVVLQLSRQARDHGSAATRTEVGLLRELAATLVERGAHSVIVVPAIAKNRVDQVVAELARRLGPNQGRPLGTLAEGVRACRAALALIKEGDHSAVADEVTLFLNEIPYEVEED